jgi:drug/metabolite transporter (DMT)-like permease
LSTDARIPLAYAAASPVERPGRATGVVLLALLTVVWGSTFVVIQLMEKDPAGAVAPSLLNLSRFALAAVLLAPFAGRDVRLWAVGLELGFWLWCGYASQAIGLRHTTVGRSAFITSLNAIFVPTLTALAGRRVRWFVWPAAGMALIGTALLSYDGSPPNRGDVWTLVTALTYAIYIFRLERYAGRFASVPLTAVQLAAVTLYCAGWAAIERPPLPPASWTTAGCILYLGIVCTALTTWLQVIGQKTVPGTQAALLYTMEPVWAATFAWIAFREHFGSRGWAGAAILLAAAIFSQRPWPATAAIEPRTAVEHAA